MHARAISLLVLLGGCVTAPAPSIDASAPIANDAGFTPDSPSSAPDAASVVAPDAATLPDAGPAGCTFPAVVPSLHNEVPMLLDYASVGDEDNARLLADGCEYLLVVGDKRDAPSSRMRSDAVRSRGGRSGYVVGGNGTLIRQWLREDGVDATAARLRARLDAGYDYVVIDEITADPEWADSNEVSTRFRRLLDAMPVGSVIAYVSIDLTQYGGGGTQLADRRWAMRALQRSGGRMALEVYLHTASVMAGNAPAAFRTAADRLASAVSGMEDAENIQRSAFVALGLSIQTTPAQYAYLDQPSHDLASLDRQIDALTASARLSQQRGVGYYFVNRSDITPSSGAPYSLDQLIDRMAHDARGHLSAIGP